MEEQTNPSHQTSDLDLTMGLVRKTADINLAYLNQVQADLQQTHHLSERIKRMKRKDLALLMNRFRTSLEKKVQTAFRIQGDFCTMIVFHEWTIEPNQDARDEYLLCLNLLIEAHHDTFAWANNHSEEPHPAGGRLRANPVEERHKHINILTSCRAPANDLVRLGGSKDIDDPFLKGLSEVISEAEEVAASNRRIEAIIDLIETMSFSYGATGETFSGTFHARRLASTMRLHQMKPSLAEVNSTWEIVGGDE
jgi:hypothetical protein